MVVLLDVDRGELGSFESRESHVKAMCTKISPDSTHGCLRRLSIVMRCSGLCWKPCCEPQNQYAEEKGTLSMAPMISWLSLDSHGGISYVPR